MRIERMLVSMQHLEYRDPDWRTATHSASSVPGIYIGLEAESMIGIGATAVNVRQASLESALEDLRSVIRPRLIGKTVSEAKQELRDLSGKCHARTLLGLDLAMHDLIGRSAGLPAEALWGGQCRDKVQVIRMVGLKEPAALVSAVGDLVEEGYSAVKVKLGTGIEDDAARIAAIRSAYSASLKIVVDANGSYSAEEAVALGRRLEEFDIEFLEQPVEYDDIDALRYVRLHSPIRVVADQCVSSVSTALAVCQAGAADGISIKLTKMGSVEECLRVISICEAFGVEVHLGGSGVPSLVDSAAYRLAVSQPAIDASCEVGESEALAGDLYPSISIVNGEIVADGSIGLGGSQWSEIGML